MKTLMPLILLLVISSCNKKNNSCSDTTLSGTTSSGEDISGENCSSDGTDVVISDPVEGDGTQTPVEVGDDDVTDDTLPETPSENPTEPPTDTPTDEPDDSSTEVPSSLPNEAFLFETTVKFTNFGVDDEEKVYKALEIIKTIVRTEEFRDRVLNYTYQGKKQFVDNNGLTNEEIYLKLLDGKESLLPVIDHEMDLDLELYYSWRSTVGYTYPNTMRIWMNTKFFNYYTPAEVAGNIFHEWTHKLGFDHASSYSTSRDSSVPYAIGYLIEELGKKYE